MNKKALSTLVMTLAFISSGWAQVMTVCTPEQLAAANNRKLASAIVVRDTASQQLQTYYSQLATYYQQLDKDNQQKAKDTQQIAKDKQQIEKDAQQWNYDKTLCAREASLSCQVGEYDEVKAFIDCLLPMLDQCGNGDKVVELKNEVKKVHTNRSGGGDLTNPGGGGNLNGFLNPHFVRR